MSSIDVAYIIIFVICLGLSAFFSGAEIAFFSLQRFRLERMVNEKMKGASLVAKMMERPEKLLSTVLLGNNFVNIVMAAIATQFAVSLWGDKGIIIASLGVTAVVLVFGETTPKTIAAERPERMSVLFARPIQFLSWLFTPFVLILSWIAAGFSRLAGSNPVPRSLVSEEEIRAMISAGREGGTIEEAAASMLHRVFDFGDRPVREIMVPRAEIIFLEQNARIKGFLLLYTQHPLSRFPVYKGNRDNVVGIISIKDVLMALAKGTVDNETPLEGLLRPAYFVHETKRIDELFAEMRDKNYHLAVVVDEYGGTAGVVSLSGLIEEIVGPLRDELAEVEKGYQEVGEHTYQVDGNMRIGEVNKALGLDLPEGDYETVAGFVLYILGYIPKQGEQIKYRDLKMIITKMHGLKIEELLITKEAHAAAAH